jgi:hypothetical protein
MSYSERRCTTIKSIIMPGLLFFLFSALTGICAAAETPLAGKSVDFGHGGLKVSANGRFLIHSDGTPFFYLGDTAWELFHRLNREEAELYLENRRQKGFTVIQSVVLNEFDALLTPNPYGDMLFIDNDLAKPNEAYFKHIDFIVETALDKGMAIAMLPVWGDKVGPKNDWGLGPEKFVNITNARAYGRYLGARYKDKPNIIWVLGGDRTPKGYELVWRELAAGLKDGDGGSHLISYHPNGWASSSDLLHKEPWLDFNMFQSGHSVRDVENFTKIEADYAKKPIKPCMDAEAPYEDAAVGYDPVGAKGYFNDFDVRQTAYWAVFAGAFGHTYGCSSIFQFYTPERQPIGSIRSPWTTALDFPGAWDMGHLRALMESRPFLTRIPRQQLMAKGKGTGGNTLRARPDKR